jgi:hypothetical protein
MFSRSPMRALKLAGIGVAATAVVAAAPAAVAAPAPAHSARVAVAKKPTLSPPFTLGLSDNTAKPGQRIVASGLANARAGLPLTLISKAISSSKSVKGFPAVTTPALVEGIFRTTIRIPPAIKNGTYTIKLKFKGKQVAQTTVRVISNSPVRGGCAGIGFTVLHNDKAGVAYLPKGGYNVTSRNISCSAASQQFVKFLAAAGKPLAGWTSSSSGTGKGTFTQKSNGHSFSVAKK